jgi:8-oxo-dGTP diphosphatase
MAQKPIPSAGGIVLRKGARRLIAVVRRSKDDRWVLPRGKLKRKERALSAARREAFEETGHKVEVREYLGAMIYRAQNRPKLVQFWHMKAARNPSRDLTPDIAAVAWLPFAKAVQRLSYPLEKVFLEAVGRDLVRKRAGKRRGKASAAKKQAKSPRRKRSATRR